MNIKKAQVAQVDHTTGIATLNSVDIRGLQVPNVIMSQPYVGQGWGIRAGAETNSTVLLFDDESGENFIVGYLTDRKFFQGIPAEEDSATGNAPKYKNITEGEIAIQSKANSVIFLNQDGDIILNTPDGTEFSINKSTDSINQLSVNSEVITEGANITSGVVRRDIRTDQEKVDDLFLTSLIGYDFSALENTDIIGVDSTHKISTDTDSLTGVFDPATGTPSILNIPGISGIPFAKRIVSSITNPALTEYHIDVKEFSDGFASLNIADLDDASLKAGWLPPNLGARFVLGTVVNDKGRIPRFDYVFSSPKAHGDLWKLPGVNDQQVSVDFKIDPAKSITTVESPGSSSQWIVSGTDRFNTAIAFQLLLNTRGADNKGNIPSASGPGSTWSFQVDKEGMTKWNIPASTTLSGKESFRSGRSLLWNMDGSWTQSIGMETSQDLGNITGTGSASFVNALKVRQHRSWTADFEGSVEWRMGADTIGQSHMIQADGALSFYYGKFQANESSVVASTNTPGVDSPSKSGKRVGTSISGQTEGSIELKVGVNNASSAQSIALATDGLVAIALGQDTKQDSLKIDAAGSIHLQTVNGGHKIELFSNEATGGFKDGIKIQHGGPAQSLIQIDANGVITLRNSLANSNIIMSQNGDINLINVTGTKISLTSDGTVSLGSGLAGIDISPTDGIVLRTPGGSISLNPEGKVEIAANLGFSVTGLQAHLNTTGVLFGPGAPTSPFRVAICGGGIGIDPLTGTSQTGYSLIGAIG